MSDGILLIDKEEGLTSRAVDNQIQRVFHTRRVGHLGTLDPFATGLLLLAIGGGTKYLPYLPDEEKTYVATLRLGASSSTGDYTGEITEGKAPQNLDKKQIDAVFAAFLGKQSQLPPMTSAIKKDGVPLYKLAHEGKEIERETREIDVKKLLLLSIEPDSITFITTVSKGTYIRTLGEDIAKALGTSGYLVSLRRVAIGPISVTGAKKLSEICEDDIIDPTPFIQYSAFELRGDEAKKARNGMPMMLPCNATRVKLMEGGVLLAIYERTDEGNYRCLRGFC